MSDTKIPEIGEVFKHGDVWLKAETEPDRGTCPEDTCCSPCYFYRKPNCHGSPPCNAKDRNGPPCIFVAVPDPENCDKTPTSMAGMLALLQQWRDSNTAIGEIEAASNCDMVISFLSRVPPSSVVASIRKEIVATRPTEDNIRGNLDRGWQESCDYFLAYIDALPPDIAPTPAKQPVLASDFDKWWLTTGEKIRVPGDTSFRKDYRTFAKAGWVARSRRVPADETNVPELKRQLAEANANAMTLRKQLAEERNRSVHHIETIKRLTRERDDSDKSIDLQCTEIGDLDNQLERVRKQLDLVQTQFDKTIDDLHGEARDAMDLRKQLDEAQLETSNALNVAGARNLECKRSIADVQRLRKQLAGPL